MKFLAAFVDRFLNRIAPLPENNRPHWLAVAEASRESWESGELNNADCPECFPEGWEDLIHDPVCVDDVDDLDPAPRPASARRGGAEPAGTGYLSPVPAGAPPHPAVLISRTFREVGVAVPPAAAEIVATELTKFYNLTPR